jgi:transcriptional regulator of acetoin/glycerol metabolism
VLTPTAARALVDYAWPNNVRELEMALTSALALADEVIDLGHLPAAVRDALGDRAAVASGDGEPLPEAEARLRAELVAQLEQHAGNVSAVARDMGKGRMQIHRWLKRFGLDLGAFRR